MPFKVWIAFGAITGICLYSLLCLPQGIRAAEPAEMPPTAPEATLASVPASPALTLEDALFKTEKFSPELIAYSEEIRAREAEVTQAGIRPNPELAVELENVAGSGQFSSFDNAETTVRLSQLLELGDKRRRRRQVAALDQSLAEISYKNARFRALSLASGRFVALLAAQERLTLAGDQLALAREALDAAEERIRAGKAPAIERASLQAILADARLVKDKARRKLAAARFAMAASWGSERPDFGRAEGDLAALPPMPPWEAVKSWAIQSPEVARSEVAVAHSKEVVALENARKVVDLTLGMGIKNTRETDDNALVLEFSVPLPVFDRNQGSALAARARMAKTRAAQRATTLQAMVTLSGAWQDLSNARREIHVLQEEILPNATRAFEAIQYGYRAGKFGLLEILNAQRALFEARQRHIAALAAYQQGFADMEGLLGRKLNSPSQTAQTVYKDRGDS